MQLRIAFTALVVVTCALGGNELLAEAVGSCDAVYAGAMNRIHLSMSNSEQRTFYFQDYCEKSGQVKASALSGDLAATIKKIPFNFSASSKTNEEKMKEFCKVTVEQGEDDSSKLLLLKEPVEEISKNYNACLLIERGTGVVLSYEVTPPESLVFVGDYRDNGGKKFVLQGMTYDSALVECSTTTVNSGDKVVVDLSKSYTIKQDFTISCRRLPIETDAKKHYPRTTVVLASNFGAMGVTLPEDESYGIALASQAQAQVQALKKELDAAKKDGEALRERLRNAKAEAFSFYTSEFKLPGSFGPHGSYENCPQNGGKSPKEKAAAICGNRDFFLKELDKVSGGKCGTGYYLVACLSK